MAGSALALPSCSRQTASAREIEIVMTQGVSGLTVHEVAKAQGFFEEFDIVPKLLLVSDGGK